MKKSKLLILGLIALMLAGGLVLVSCSACPGGGSLEGTSKGCTSNYGKTECENHCITAQQNASGLGQSYHCNCN